MIGMDLRFDTDAAKMHVTMYTSTFVSLAVLPKVDAASGVYMNHFSVFKNGDTYDVHASLKWRDGHEEKVVLEKQTWAYVENYIDACIAHYL